MHLGSDGFIERMAKMGLEPSVEVQLVTYWIAPIDGAHTGIAVHTGVAIDELARWPLVPPHWIHLPSTIAFAHTNSRPSPRPGWLMHSRQIKRWGTDPDPGVGWAGHVRSALGAATE